MRGVVLGGRYQLREPLGSGGMGTVWRATDQVRQRVVAVKTVVGHGGAETSELARRFRREFRVASLLSSPHIVEVHDSGEAVVDGRPLLYLVMDEIPGEPLSRLLTARRPTLAEIARWGGEICEALSTMHAAGIVHRDLKPANVMIGPDGHATVLDFGIARLDADGIDLTTLTGTGHVLGTLAYMSPEQAGGAKSLDARSDLYSLGCLLYATLVGRPPFAEGPWQRVLRQHLEDAPARPSARRLGLPPAWDSLLLDLLAKQPGDRPPSAGAVRERIAELPVPRDAPPEAGPAAGTARGATAVDAEVATVVDPDAVTRDALASPPREAEASAPPHHPPTRLAPSPRPTPRVLPGDEVISRSLTGGQVLALLTVVLLVLGGLITLILIASGRETGQSAGTSALITAAGLGTFVVSGFLYGGYVYTWKPRRERLQTTRQLEAKLAQAARERAQADEEQAAASGAGTPAHQQAVATVSAAIQDNRPLWVGYEHHNSIWWIHVHPVCFADGDLVSVTVTSRERYLIAEFRLRATSDVSPPGV
ncbi:serine/threonine-protein kinase [Streptomyces lasiicapitis]|uniref:non-specific serine/threonine protein kinase n=1 Tax=Streptomyces lasiicapitis TaxID=1923961 RepID=A0ABQ2M3F1_9ACTN|nr:serine/threonine-protein kinase [Streptomyces lasiicapitis]GGO46417.1 hypothetical protein GCM10012286_37300 [Streptomyces lasiicapitis]